MINIIKWFKYYFRTLDIQYVCNEDDSAIRIYDDETTIIVNHYHIVKHGTIKKSWQGHLTISGFTFGIANRQWDEDIVETHVDYFQYRGGSNLDEE